MIERMAVRLFTWKGNTAMTPLLHITTEAAWQGARQEGVYRGDTLESDGFIHASLPHQALAVAQRFYSEVPHLLLLVIDPARVVAEVRYEPGAREGDDADQRFPHMYGPLNLDAVMTVAPLLRGTDGAFVLPALPEIER